MSTCLEHAVEDEFALRADEGDALLTRCRKEPKWNIQTLGRKAANTISNKQKLNTKSCTWAEAAATN